MSTDPHDRHDPHDPPTGPVGAPPPARRSLLDRLIHGSLRHRFAVLAAAALLVVVGLLWVPRMPVDIFPDLSAPTVTLVTEAPGMAPEEIELLVTFPLESAVNGAGGVRRLRSVSADGISVIWVEFDWGTDIYRARQVVTERFQGVELPVGVDRPQLGPVSSVMGEITFVALTSEASDDAGAFELRRLAETVVRRRLLAVPGVSQVVPIGGASRQLQVTVRPEEMARHGLALDEVLDAAGRASRTAAAGFHVDGGQEYLVRGLGRATEPAEVGRTVVAVRQGVPVRVEDVADVAWGPEPARGTASYRAETAVILSVQKQPEANTLDLTEAIDQVLASLVGVLPDGVTIETENFRQADFIEVAVSNVAHALRDGAILVILVLPLFLGSWRSTLISVTAIPLSLVAGVLVVSAFGITINTMTLGGFTIAIGALVDDAIIDVENVFRRLRQQARLPEGERLGAFEVVFRASSEVRKAILFATLIIVLVFVPLLFLPGLEGLLLRPLGLAYVAALAASLLVSLTVTPVLCLLLLPKEAERRSGEPWLIRQLHRLYRPSLDWALGHRWAVLGATGVLLVVALAVGATLGRSFLPPFNEGSLTVAVVSPPGIPLAEGDHLGRQVEEVLLSHPEVVSTSRRTGRAERDEHVQGVNASEIEVVLVPAEEGRSRDELLAALRRDVAAVPGVTVSFGQPISHRIDHMISGSKTNLAVKVFGPDLSVLRGLGSQIQEALSGVPGIVDLSNQEQASVPQLVVDFDRDALARHGLAPAELATGVEALFQGVTVGQVFDRGLTTDVVVRYPSELREHRERLAALPVTSADGDLLELSRVADVRFDLGPSLIRREDVQRLAMITANVVGPDLTGTVGRAQEAVAEQVEVPEGYLITYGGQFEEAARSGRTLLWLSLFVVVAMYALLFLAFRSHVEAVVVLVNLPLALIGGILALGLSSGVLSVATLVGFVTLFGIATRNGVLLVSHYQHLRDEEDSPHEEVVVRGSRERLAPILMTAITAGLALVPLVLRAGEPGNEIQSPMAVVILGGLVTSTLLNLVVVPVLYDWWVGEGQDDEAPMVA